ncbi:hypothetical protein DFH08DRAFT_974394 [Mycena albidolilacea]|uniref:Aminoglycoside phosphotransferase domain-containing protein n=1 Tax=Mycena albidolilacea TaxID=1033008 RepID=A0AAD7EBS7_9AGAR|nr:hypothetical protein DFH08DRAFT_974394 [Mycena albidolilacea]
MAVDAKPAKMNGTANKPNGSAGHHNPMPHPSTPNQSPPPEPLEWDWDIEHADRARERQADAALHGATPFEVDRRVLKDVVLEHMKTPVARIVFMSAGTFHKAYLITLTSSHQVVARVARRFMPRLKTESEVATLRYLRENTRVPVPEVICYDANPYNRLGGEWILMSKAPGTPLSQVYHSLSYAQLVRLLDSLARLVVPLFGHRFAQIGSLYLGPDPTAPSPPSHSNAPTPTLTRASTLTMSSLSTAFSSLVDTPRASQKQETYGAFPFTPALTPRAPPLSASAASASPSKSEYHVGSIISWPFFGSFRGDLPSAPSAASPEYVPRGPFPATPAYFAGCVEREVLAVQRENAGSAAGHRLHLDPAEILSSRHHRVVGVEGDESDDSDEWGLEESEDEWEGPGDVMYRDYRRGQRGAFLVAHTQKREESVRRELARWMRVVERLSDEWRAEGERAGVGGGAKHKDGNHKDGDGAEEEFALDAHDLSLENVFVDPADPTVITCVIDWESTTTRPLWAAAHLPAFLQSSPFTAKLFREAVSRLADPTAVAGNIGSRRPSDSRPNGNNSPRRTSDSKPSGNGVKPESNSKPTVPAPDATDADAKTVARLAREWLHHERTGMRLRMAHRVVEWDGWEEGLVESILGPEDIEEEWFHPDHEDDGDADSDHEGEMRLCVDVCGDGARNGNGGVNGFEDEDNGEGRGMGLGLAIGKSLSRRQDSDPEAGGGVGVKGRAVVPKAKAKGGTTTGKPAGGKLFAKNLEREKEQMLDTTGDICGGRGGELGRRLEAWLTHSGNTSPDDEEGPGAVWLEQHNELHDNIESGGYEAEAETD